MKTLSKPNIPTLDDCLSAGSLFFKGLAKALGQALLLMSLLRFLIYWNSLNHFAGVETGTLVHAFLVGVRFDLLVLGFVMIPVVILVLVVCWVRRGLRGVMRASEWFLSLFWLLLVWVSFFDLLFFSLEGRHLTAFDFTRGDARFATSAGQRLGWEGLLLTLAIFLCAAAVGCRSFLATAVPEMKNSGYRRGWGERLLRTFGPLFLVALAARGTVTAHHLEKQHSEISDRHSVNQLAQNSLWAFDKKPEETDAVSSPPTSGR